MFQLNNICTNIIILWSDGSGMRKQPQDSFWSLWQLLDLFCFSVTLDQNFLKQAKRIQSSYYSHRFWQGIVCVIHPKQPENLCCRLANIHRHRECMCLCVSVHFSPWLTQRSPDSGLFCYFVLFPPFPLWKFTNISPVVWSQHGQSDKIHY